MSAFSSCCDTFKLLSRAAAKAASGRLRRMGIGGTHPAWAARAEVCERCPLRVIKRGVSYCGDPFLSDIHRDVTRQGCGCPTHAKARDPQEHCPLNLRYEPASHGADCNCRWCLLASAAPRH
jgi:hypothetical protein